MQFLYFFNLVRSNSILEATETFILHLWHFLRFNLILKPSFRDRQVVTASHADGGALPLITALLREQMRILSFQQAEFNLQSWCVDSPS